MPYTHLPDRCVLCGKATRRWRLMLAGAEVRAIIPVCFRCGKDCEAEITRFCEPPRKPRRSHPQPSSPPDPPGKQGSLF